MSVGVCLLPRGVCGEAVILPLATFSVRGEGDWSSRNRGIVRASVWRFCLSRLVHVAEPLLEVRLFTSSTAEWAVKTWATPVTLDTSLPPAEAVGETDVAEREEGEAADEASEGGNRLLAGGSSAGAAPGENSSGCRST